MKKYEGAISDTDILINLAKVQELDILSLCVYFKTISDIQGEDIYNKINSTLSKSSSLTFDDIYTRSFRRFRDNGWNDYLEIT